MVAFWLQQQGIGQTKGESSKRIGPPIWGRHGGFTSSCPNCPGVFRSACRLWCNFTQIPIRPEILHITKICGVTNVFEIPFVIIAKFVLARDYFVIHISANSYEIQNNSTPHHFMRSALKLLRNSFSRNIYFWKAVLVIILAAMVCSGFSDSFRLILRANQGNNPCRPLL